MEYILAFQLLCGFFSAFLAVRKHRSLTGWFAIGLLVPVAGVIFAWVIGPYSLKDSQKQSDMPTEKPAGKRPKRCCGYYVPDCQGCPYFEKPLFDKSFEGDRKGRCRFYGRVLEQNEEEKKSRAIVED
ncbi:MAG: hypothetical protein ACLFWL_09365 [Candidatus Brocadiia bacterium]